MGLFLRVQVGARGGGDNKGVIAPRRLAHRFCVTLELKESGRGIARGVVAKRVAVTAVFAFIT